MDAKVDDRFAEIARKIGDGRLEKVLRELADNVKNEIHNAHAQFNPKRADVRAKIQQLRADAERFLKSLKSLSGFYLLDLPWEAKERVPRARQAMTEILALCDETLIMVSPKIFLKIF